MIKHSLVIVMFILGFSNSSVKAQATQQPDSLGLPGDNLNLYAVMQLFQNSETLEGFEKTLNAEDTKINNLDLNNDDKIDYIRVVDNVDKEVHNIVLQVPINDKENQDVATFIVEKNNKGGVDIQLIGDEDLYGKNYIVEPNYIDTPAITSTKETPNPGYVKQYTQKTTDSKGNTTIINNYTTTQTASWPVVSYIFRPNYVAWISPWRWAYYPSYWNPWTPWYWHRYYGYHYNNRYFYFRDYRFCHYYRNPVVYQNYYSRRSNSLVINININSGKYSRCYAHPESRFIGKRDFYRDSKNNHNRINRGYSDFNVGKTPTKFANVNSPTPNINKPKHQATHKSKDHPIFNSSNQYENMERRPFNREVGNHSSGRGERRRPK
jgi:hypothetical protein